MSMNGDRPSLPFTIYEPKTPQVIVLFVSLLCVVLAVWWVTLGHSKSLFWLLFGLYSGVEAIRKVFFILFQKSQPMYVYPVNLRDRGRWKAKSLCCLG
jgi:hypothetical protein